MTGHLVDRIGFRDEAYGRIAELVGVEGVSPETGDADSDDNAPPRLYLSRYAQARKGGPPVPMPSRPGPQASPTIAVVTVDGVDRQRPRRAAGAAVRARPTPAVTPSRAALREVGADDDVAAVVLRVDSPGGSVTGSETHLAGSDAGARQRGKPVVASMGAVAASGGYYVSMGADAIVANPGTITGSIGVITGKLVARELKERLGVGSDTRAHQRQRRCLVGQRAVHPGAAGPGGGRGRPVLHRLRAAGRRGARTCPSRRSTRWRRGRVWTGADALERGLVDELGGLRTAVRRAKVLAGLDVDAEVGTGQLSRLVAAGHAATPSASSQPAAASLPEAVGGAARPLGQRVCWTTASRR